LELILVLIGFILCALASFMGAFLGVRSLSDSSKPLRIPIYTDIKDAIENKRIDQNVAGNKRILNDYFYGKDEPEDLEDA